MTDLPTIILLILGALGLGWGLLGRRSRAGTPDVTSKGKDSDPTSAPGLRYDDEDHRENETAAADTDADSRPDDAVDDVVRDILSKRQRIPK